jgi:protein-tyrosine phosphatase
MPFSNYDWENVWQSFLDEKIHLVILLTEQQEYLVYSGKDLPQFYRSNGLEVLHIPVPDFGIPEDLMKWNMGLQKAAQTAKEGKNVAVHCLAGVGRTGTFLACLAKENLDLTGEQAISWVRESIPGAMENSHQESFVLDFYPKRAR